jgi:pilus assembly protein Flp/PilA
MLVQKFCAKVSAFIRSDDGATAIEYGLIAAGIAVAISAAVFTFGSNLSVMFSSVGQSLANVNTTVGTGT